MDMVVCAGKSLKNNDVYVLLPPDCKKAVDVLIKYRNEVGVPMENPYLFARMQANTPLSANTELLEFATNCPGLQYPERITSTCLRRYIATVSQVCFKIVFSVEVILQNSMFIIQIFQNNCLAFFFSRSLI